MRAVKIRGLTNPIIVYNVARILLTGASLRGRLRGKKGLIIDRNPLNPNWHEL